MSRMVIMYVFNALTTFESQIQSYKHDTEVTILCFVNKDRFLLKLTHVMHWYKFQSNVAYFVDKIIYEHIKSVYFVYHMQFCERNVCTRQYL